MTEHDAVYCYPGVNVLRDRPGIRDASRLAQVESAITASALIVLALRPPGTTFDTAHLQAIHKALFSPLYDWAGHFRRVDIAKNGMMPFCRPEFIRDQLDALFRKLAGDRYLRGSAPEPFIDRATLYLGEINAIHPFREGNGRTQREFIRQLARFNGYDLNWTRVSQDEMIRASRQSFCQGDDSALRHLIAGALIVTPGGASGRN